MRASSITTILLFPLLALAIPATPSGSDLAAANAVVDDGTIYFGPSRATGAEAEADGLDAEVSSMADPIYCSGKLAWVDDVSNAIQPLLLPRDAG